MIQENLNNEKNVPNKNLKEKMKSTQNLGAHRTAPEAYPESSPLSAEMPYGDDMINLEDNQFAQADGAIIPDDSSSVLADHWPQWRNSFQQKFSKFNDEELSDLNGDYDQLVEQLGPKYGYNAAMKLKTMWINLLRIHGIKFNSSIPRSSS